MPKYGRLLGKIAQDFKTQTEFADCMGMSTRTLYSKLRGESPWTLTEMKNALHLLGVPVEEVEVYFFEE